MCYNGSSVLSHNLTSGGVFRLPESGMFGLIYRITDVIYKLAWSNVLWFFTAGFPLTLLLLGDWTIPTLLFLLIGPPGTAALFHVMRVWLEDEDVSVWREYWRGWRANWKRAYKVIDAYLLIGIILIVDLVVVANAADSFVKWVGFLLLPILTLYVLTSVTLLPLLVRFEWKFLELIKNAFIMSIGHLFSTLAILIGVGVVVVGVFQMMPPLAFFFFASVTAWAFSWQTDRIVRRIQRMAEDQEDEEEDGQAEQTTDEQAHH